jgi:hypothetical protein
MGFHHCDADTFSHKELRVTLEELKAIPLQYCFGYSADSHGLRQYISDDNKIAKQVYTPRNKKTGEWGNGQTTFKLMETGEEFNTVAELLAAINKDKT